MATKAAANPPVPVPPDQEVLLEFKAGKMVANGTRVVPDPRKGLVRLVKAEDTLLHFQWWDRTTFLVEDDQIVFPEEATFEKVGQSSGRVYLLKFKHDDRKSFFWMQNIRNSLSMLKLMGNSSFSYILPDRRRVQTFTTVAEVDKDQDAGVCNIVTHHLNHPLGKDTIRPHICSLLLLELSVAETDGEDEPEDSPQPLSDNSEGTANELLEATPTSRDLTGGNLSLPEGIPAGSDTGVVQLADLQRILSGLGQPPEVDYSMARDTGPGFSELLKPDVVRPLLESLQLEERLAPYLPEGVRTKQAIAELMQSPQFHQQLDAFTQVIRSGQIDLSQFGMDTSGYNFTVASFLEAIEDQAASGLNEQENEDRSNQDVMEEGR